MGVQRSFAGESASRGGLSKIGMIRLRTEESMARFKADSAHGESALLGAAAACAPEAQRLILKRIRTFFESLHLFHKGQLARLSADQLSAGLLMGSEEAPVEGRSGNAALPSKPKAPPRILQSGGNALQ